MGRRRKNTFSKALGHLKSTTIDEKLQMLSERPTNSVMTYMTTVANTVNPDFVSSERGQENALGVIEPDFSVGEDPTTSEEAKDTSGLFKEDGTIRVAQPPITGASPDRSYILGPMAAMYYTWSYPWTMIGYIRQSDRKFVNLARIDGKLSDWDGSSNFNNSYWGSQLTLEQAVWFRDVQKNPGATNDPATYNYRAFYPGPPSNTPDAFGRYYCITTGEPIDPKLPGVGEPPNKPGEGGEPTPGDIFSAIMDRLNKGERLSNKEKEWLKGKLPPLGTSKGNRMQKDSWAMDPDKFRKKYGLDPDRVFDYYKYYGYGQGSAESQSNVDKAVGHGLSSERANEMSPAELAQFVAQQDSLQADIDKYSQQQKDYEKQARDIAIGFGVDIALTLFGGALIKGIGKGVQLGYKGLKAADRAKNIAKAAKMIKAADKIDDAAAVAKATKAYDKAAKIAQQAKNTHNAQRIANATRKSQQASEKLKGVGNKKGFQGIKDYINKGKFQQVADEDTAGFFKLLKNDIDQMGKFVKKGSRNKPFKDLTKADFEGGPLPTNLDQLSQFLQGKGGMAWSFSRGTGTGPTPLFRQMPRLIKGGFKNIGKKFGALGIKKGSEGGDVRALPYKGPGKSVGSLPGSKGPKGDKVYSGGSKDFDERTGKYRSGKKSVGSLPGSKGPKGGKVYAGGSKDFDERTGKYRSGKKSVARLTASYHLQASTLSESRKTEILKNLKKPVVLPETKQKSYKVKPKLRGIISKPHIAKASAPAEYKPPENLWGKEEYNHNVKRSQEKMNAVYELLGDGSMALEHMLTDSNKMNAAQLDKFWGLHPELYSYFYNGKKYKAIRKEQLKGDYLVFLIDENGVKSNILQSELNEKLAEEQEMKELEEYNKMNPKKEPISFEKDYMFKKAYQKLKKEVDYPKKPAKKGYPDEPPPKMVNGYHPEFGKRYKYDKLDPHSAEAMPNQDNPEIDANIEKAKKQPKIQPGKKPKVIPIETKTEQLQLSDWRKDLTNA